MNHFYVLFCFWFLSLGNIFSLDTYILIEWLPLCVKGNKTPNQTHTHTHTHTHTPSLSRLKEICFIPHKGLWICVFFQVISRLGWWFDTIKSLSLAKTFILLYFYQFTMVLKLSKDKITDFPLAGLLFKNMPLWFLVSRPAFEPSPGPMDLGHSEPCSFGHGTSKLWYISCLSPA